MTLRLIYCGDLGLRQIGLLAIGVAVAFAAIAVLLLRLLPAPHTHMHYLIAGAMPTVLGLIGAMAWINHKRLRPRGLVVRRITRED